VISIELSKWIYSSGSFHILAIVNNILSIYFQGIFRLTLVSKDCESRIGFQNIKTCRSAFLLSK
jgi:hypothetical protein